MTCRGVHFAITPEQMEKLHSCETDKELVEYVTGHIEDSWEEEWLRETDKAWDAIHRCLTDGKLGYENGSFPLNACIFGGEILNNEDDFVVSLVKPEQVPDIAKALSEVTKEYMREKYFAIDPDDYDLDVGEEDFEYTWHWFQELPDLFKKAAEAERAVIFTVDY